MDYEVPPIALDRSGMLPAELVTALAAQFHACVQTGLATDEARQTARRVLAELSAAERDEADRPESPVVAAARERLSIAWRAEDDLEALLADLVVQAATAVSRVAAAVIQGLPAALQDVTTTNAVRFDDFYTRPELVPYVALDDDVEAASPRHLHRQLLQDLAAAHTVTGGTLDKTQHDGYGGFRRQLVEALYEYAHTCGYALARRMRDDAGSGDR